MIDGRSGHSFGEPEAQNWKSGIELTVLGCTFFRNFAAVFSAAMQIVDVWPLVAKYDSNNFAHNEAGICAQHTSNWFNSYVSRSAIFAHRLLSASNHNLMAQTGPQRRVGASSLTETNAYYDGGFASAGVFTYYIIDFPWIDGVGDEPDAQWTFSHDSCTYVDHGSFAGTGIFLGMVFPLDNPRRVEVSMVDSSVSDSMAVGPVGTSYDSDYIHTSHAQEGKMRIAQSRFTRSGNFDSTVSQGMGGTRAFAPAAGPLTTPALEFEGAAWEGNAAPIGPALSIQFGQCELEVRNCLLRGNTAYKSVSNPSNSTLCARVRAVSLTRREDCHFRVERSLLRHCLARRCFSRRASLTEMCCECRWTGGPLILPSFSTL